MDTALKTGLAIFSAIIGLAILSVIVSRRSQAPQVIQASASALSNVIRAAVDPVATAATNGNLGNNTWSNDGGFELPDVFSGLKLPFPFTGLR